jgi:structural toxin protein (hemagglutinin/hemolysin) RtxA
MYKICFYVPENYADVVKNAMFMAGAGKIGKYANCCWQTMGEGQFMPLLGSNAFKGDIDNLEKIQELKVEMVCEDKLIQAAVSALKSSHPYEEPAYQVWQLAVF